MDPFSLLNSTYPNDLLENLRQSYEEIASNFLLGHWKASEIDGGHFVESVRRIIELELTGISTPIDQNLPRFDDRVLTAYENCAGHESFRLIIPRILKSIYNIRNKRGVGHIRGISPNKMDATLILYNAKWVLAEIIRLKSNLPPEQTQIIVDELVERQVEVLWKEGDIKKILIPSMSYTEKILVILYDTSPMQFKELQKVTEQYHVTRFRKNIIDLHKRALLHFDGENCTISPTGKLMAEKILLRYRIS